MMKEIIASGKTWEEAKESATSLLGAAETDDVQYEILDMGSRGIFGLIGTRPAKVRAWIELPDTAAPRQHGEVPARNTDKKPEERRNRPERSDRPRQDAKAPEKDGSKDNRNRNNRRKGGRDRNGMTPPSDFVAPSAPAVIKEAVIPESELKMEPYAAEEGEDLSFDFIRNLVADLEINATVALFHCEDNTRRIVVTGEDASALIGHHGDTLDALQYLANLASAKKNKNGERNRRRVTLDIDGYRAKREEALRALARRMAAKALRNNRSVMLEPMTPYERRIIHSEIQNIDGVSTNSIGADNNRKIVIYLTEKTTPKAEETAADVTETAETTDMAEAVDVAEAVEAAEEVAEAAEEAAEAVEAAEEITAVAEEITEAAEEIAEAADDTADEI